jgi:hypothetical protein
MSQLIHPFWPVSRKALSVAGVALLLAGAEFLWTQHDAVRNTTLWTQRIVVRADTMTPGADRTVEEKLDGSGGSFDLKAGDDCLYVDNSAWSYQDLAGHSTMALVFCPARGAGWASRDFLEANRAQGRP